MLHNNIWDFFSEGEVSVTIAYNGIEYNCGECSCMDKDLKVTESHVRTTHRKKAAVVRYKMANVTFLTLKTTDLEVGEYFYFENACTFFCGRYHCTLCKFKTEQLESWKDHEGYLYHKNLVQKERTERQKMRSNSSQSMYKQEILDILTVNFKEAVKNTTFLICHDVA